MCQSVDSGIKARDNGLVLAVPSAPILPHKGKLFMPSLNWAFHRRVAPVTPLVFLFLRTPRYARGSGGRAFAAEFFFIYAFNSYKKKVLDSAKAGRDPPFKNGIILPITFIQLDSGIKKMLLMGT